MNELQEQRQVALMFKAYRECALWSSQDDEDPEDWRECEVDPATELAMLNNVRFFHTNVMRAKQLIRPDQIELAGHNLWLSHNGHGAGFFDSPEVWGKYTDLLQEISESVTEMELYRGDDGVIYH